MADAAVAWFSVTPQLVAAALMVALAVALVVLNRRSLVAWAFAAFLVVRAAVILATRFLILTNAQDGVVSQPGLSQSLELLDPFLRLALAPAIVFFVLVHHRPAATRLWMTLRVAVLVALVAAELFMLNNVLHGHTCAYRCATSAGTVANSLTLLPSLADAATGVAGLYFAFVALRRPIGPLHNSVFLLSVGFSLNALLDGGNVVLDILQNGGTAGYTAGLAGGQGFVLVGIALSILGFLAAAASLGLYGFDAGRNHDLWPTTLAAYAAAAWVLATSAYIVFSPDQPAPGQYLMPSSMLAYFLVGFWRFALAGLGALALVKHRLFGIEVKINHGVSRSIVAGCFLGVFFVVTQILQNLMSNTTLGVVGGGTAAGLMLFALHPLEKAGHRIAHAVVPGGRPNAAIAHSEALDIYRQQSMLVWADGVMGRKERALLDQLRNRLRLSVEEAAKLEHDAATTVPLGRYPARTNKRTTSRGVQIK